MIVIERWSLYRNSVNNDHLIKSLLRKGFLKKSTFKSNVKSTLGETNLLQSSQKYKQLLVRKICQQLYKARGTRKKLLQSSQKLRTTLQSLWDSPITFGKFVKNAKKLCEVCRRSDFKCLKVFLYSSFTRLNIIIGKHECFVSTFHVSRMLFTNKLNNGYYIRVEKIPGTVKK